MHSIFQDAITPKDIALSIRTDNKFFNELKAVLFDENKVLMARLKAWKFNAEQVRYKSIFSTESVVGKLLELFMFHPHLSSGITKYWSEQKVKDQLTAWPWITSLFILRNYM